MRRALPDVLRIGAVRRAHHIGSVATTGILPNDEGDYAISFLCIIFQMQQRWAKVNPAVGQISSTKLRDSIGRVEVYFEVR